LEGGAFKTEEQDLRPKSKTIRPVRRQQARRFKWQMTNGKWPMTN